MLHILSAGSNMICLWVFKNRFFFMGKMGEGEGWERLKDITVWRKAAEQVLFSLSVSWGGLIMYGSYNKFSTRVHIHATLIGILDFVTSLIAGVVVFSVLGHLSCKVRTNMSYKV